MKTVYDVQGNPALNANSGVFFGDNTANGGAMINNVVNAYGTMDMINNGVGTTLQVVQQGATANMFTKALDVQDDGAPELTTSTNQWQNVFFSGPYDDYTADFADSAIIGCNYDMDIQGAVSYCGNIWATESGEAWGKVITNGDARLAEGQIGQQSWTGAAADGWDGDVTMSGGSSIYSSFFGETLVPAGSSVSTVAAATETHSWNNGGGTVYTNHNQPTERALEDAIN